ncbi:hypothetical protein B0O99DRAFT_328504 [Bisporella sp. PMI_857]|nr:hypothetical protein B0O99DRAFT_364425 [Bisporella sp. PMI_857]KAH8600556.1 hypothetical protein B0O99DRAFT_328504 [Bisporella sp. PMI_857]
MVQTNYLDCSNTVSPCFLSHYWSPRCEDCFVQAGTWSQPRASRRVDGSQSFFSTMKTQALLGPLKPLAICLIIVWLLSPFGSQAMLRSLSVDLVHESGVTVIPYFNAQQPASIDAGSWFPAFISSFATSILSSPAAKNDSSDLWGNAKVPLLSSLSNFTSEDSEGWLPVNEGNFQYSSLFGIPIFLPDVNITTLPLKSSYIQLFCHDLTSNVTRKGNTFSNPGLLSPSGPFFTTSTVTATTSWALGYLGLDTTSLLSPSQNSTPSLDAIADKIQRSKSYNGLLLYEDFTGLQNVTSIYCTPAQVYVESEVSCLNSKCRVTKIRESKEDHPSGELTLLGFRDLFLAVSTVLGNNTPHLGTKSRGSVDMLQNYLSNPLNNTFIRTAIPHSYKTKSPGYSIPL